MKNSLLTLFSVTTLLFFGCSSAPTSNQSMSGVSASDSMQSVSQVASMAGFKDRKYIKTSELVCKVKDVKKTTTSIVEIVNRMGGGYSKFYYKKYYFKNRRNRNFAGFYLSGSIF